MITIRMTRGGRINRPIYTIVATDSRSPRDGKFIEKLGTYIPTATKPLTDVKVEAIKTWLTKGAQLSDTVRTLLKKHQIAVR